MLDTRNWTAPEARLTLEVFKQVIEWSTQHQKPYLWRAYLLAILTGRNQLLN
ncbi:hypothetical protein [Oceanospirillum beijerinckii]|uniref:hypothetical protein n=1 Tax=Oceanospirillum beijerinckii TaxID=64976 RepID=UPI0003F97CEF|nr:hypothetical protein [Oceanospirillum beijerinckii]